MRTILQQFIILTCVLFHAGIALADLNSNSLSLIEVTGEGKVYAKPDQAELVLRFNETNFKLDLARQQVDQQVKALISVLEDFTLKANTLDTSQISIQPRYDYRSGNQRTFVGYQVTRNVTFTLASLPELDGLVKAISDADVSGLDSIRFTHSNPKSLQKKALNKAMAHSRNLADQIAKSYERKIDKVHRVSYKPITQHVGLRTMAVAEMAADSGSSYQQRDLVFEAQVQASFTMQ